MVSKKIRIKCAIVGDEAVGKTGIVSKLKCVESIKEYVPTLFVAELIPIELDGIEIEVISFEISGRLEHAKLRRLAYENIDICMIVYNICDRESLENVYSRWISEVKDYARKSTPVLLVGTKIDLRTDESISYHIGLNFAKRIGAINFLECSALTNEGVRSIMYELLLSR